MADEAVARTVDDLVTETVAARERWAAGALRALVRERSRRLRARFTSAIIELSVAQQPLEPERAAQLTDVARYFARTGEASYISSSGALHAFLKAAALSPHASVRERALDAFEHLAVQRQDVQPLADALVLAPGRAVWSAAHAAALLRAMARCARNRPLLLQLGVHAPLLALTQRRTTLADALADALGALAALADEGAAQLGADGAVRVLCAVASTAASAAAALSLIHI